VVPPENGQNVAVGQRLKDVVDDAHGVTAGLALDAERAAGDQLLKKGFH